ncbi:ferritin-like domain-containing protein [Mucilaginibacter myungsuensis]|uniref:Ferritin-like domain-containing protein n=1 Tax=Mucilaginibacter myungsuensis TaxID=649104 RepID=A0A929KS74_9SPHI|nr:ferritin-like domain-containing protein [Mucilaginibacter myungsuensis]MBE9660534.1 ferritin-like domain-containing protein [Mucilaginibacter myungsuensis]MDN3600579.1 ferritin-like domain-containing protein [Mucilaginibacter myungsuensis]
MNILEIIDQIDKADPEFQDRIDPRRAAIKNMMGFGTKVAAAALPFAFTALLKKAYGQTATLTPAITTTLNIALRLEYFEAEFYNRGLAASTLTIPSADRSNYIAPIAAHENAHVNFLKGVLGSAALPAPAANSYDFTAGGGFATVFSDYNTFLAVAQAFEDTGVRAYKGQAGVLLGQQVFLTAALNIHSVEARHAAAIRYLRRTRGTAIKPWITGGNDTGIAAVNAVYDGEANVTQAGADISKLAGATAGTTISVNAATESFDEPLTAAQVTAIVSPFGVRFS